ncbi:MAG TPA: tripartite tricarboxylate transporter substrate binding protein [Opitutus sp.]|nr:tripartite tricarboxylate transporter substrate binding protein [Opitutus sp.]
MRTAPLMIVAAAVVAVAATIWVRKKPSGVDWPHKTVTLLVPISAGAGIDLAARLFAEQLSKKWNQAVIVDNRPGGGDAVLGWSLFASVKDDHTLLFSAAGPITMDILIRDDLPYVADDFVPIATVARPTIVIAASAALPATSLKELEALVQTQPRKYFWSAIGRLGNFFEAFLKMEKLEMTYVPYTTTPEAVQDLAAGRLQVWMSSLATVESQLLAGKVRILAVTNTDRALTLPAVQTVSEAGYPGLTLDGIWGIYGSRGMPDSLRNRIAEDIRLATSEPELTRRMSATGAPAASSTPDEFAALLEFQRKQFEKVIAILDLKKRSREIRR